MSLSPDDIVGYRFKQSLRGYAIDEVDDLLDRLADQVERTDAELVDLRGRVAAAEERAAASRRTEESLQRALVTAQETAERVIAEAEADAQQRREASEEAAQHARLDAEQRAREILSEAQSGAAREVAAARARVEDAADRQREVLADIARQRDALRGHLLELDRLVAAGVQRPSAGEGDAASVGELLEAPSDAPSSHGGSDASRADEGPDEPPADDGSDAEEAPDPSRGSGDDEPIWAEAPADDDERAASPPPPRSRTADGLTVRVRDGAGEAGAPLGSEPRGGS